MNFLCKLIHKSKIGFKNYESANSYSQKQKKLSYVPLLGESHSSFSVRRCPLCNLFFVRRRWTKKAKQIRSLLQIY